jgi:hypothetical protein
VQPSFETTTSRWGRSFNASIFLRPTNSFDLTSNYFLPAMLGGDHALKVGYRWRSAHSTTINHRGGFIEARFTNGIANSADIWRDAYQESHLDTHAIYLQDTFTRNRLTLNLGFRYDQQDDEAVAAQVPGNPHFPALMPAIDFPGADAGVVWKDFSPRIGATYDLTGDGRTILSASSAVYYGQMAPGQLSGILASTGAVFVRYPWSDTNGDGFVQVNEVNTSGAPLNRTPAYDPASPGNFRTAGTVDPNVKNDRTREFIVGFDRQLNNVMAVGASYIWRKYDRFFWNDRTDWGSENYRAVTGIPTGCPAGARCEEYTYFEPATPLPSPFMYTNVPDRWRDFDGLELTFQKRMANRWSMNASYAFNSAYDTWDSPASYEDPTCGIPVIAGGVFSCPGRHIYAPEAGGSGIDNVFINAKWLVKVAGSYVLPWDINVAASYNARQGYPFPQAIRTPNRANTGGQADVNLDEFGSVRQPNYQQLDVRLDKRFTFGRTTIRPSLDIFNAPNYSTILARRRLQAADNANQISGIVAPRVARFGVSVQW